MLLSPVDAFRPIRGPNAAVAFRTQPLDLQRLREAAVQLIRMLGGGSTRHKADFDVSGGSHFHNPMSKLSSLIDDAKAGLSVQERIPEDRWNAIAESSGAPDVAELKARIAGLRAELETVEEWDGDTQDDIHLAISKFSRLLVLTGTPPDVDE